MDKEKDFFKTCFNTVAGLEVKNENQAIAKEVILSEIEQLQQENKILRENAENNDKVVDKVNWENMLLKKENQELKSQLKGTTHCFDEEEHEKLKKQLEEYKEEKQEWINLLDMFKNQQKEFIKYLEDEIKFYKNRDTYIVADILGSYDLNDINLKLLEEILQKYKSIIGVSDEKK